MFGENDAIAHGFALPVLHRVALFRGSLLIRGDVPPIGACRRATAVCDTSIQDRSPGVAAGAARRVREMKGEIWAPRSL